MTEGSTSWPNLNWVKLVPKFLYFINKIWKLNQNDCFLLPYFLKATFSFASCYLSLMNGAKEKIAEHPTENVGNIENSQKTAQTLIIVIAGLWLDVLKNMYLMWLDDRYIHKWSSASAIEKKKHIFYIFILRKDKQ